MKSERNVRAHLPVSSFDERLTRTSSDVAETPALAKKASTGFTVEEALQIAQTGLQRDKGVEIKMAFRPTRERYRLSCHYALLLYSMGQTLAKQ